MTERRVRLTFPPKTKMRDIHDTLALALFAAEGLFGSARVRTELDLDFDVPGHRCAIGTLTEVGSATARVFIGLLTREIGEAGFRVETADK